jgi:hypothetical protein
MPALPFLAVVAVVLVALLYVADATLEPSSPMIVSSDRVGLPKPWHPDTIQTLTTAPAPAPDMTSREVLAAQPKSEHEALQKIEPAARAEAPLQNNRPTRPINYPVNSSVDRFSIQGQ